ncbi:MAG: rRNA maturation RNase YbeY [Hyphomicrobiales bacterium]|nr:rRNA maturation RNase YbeY [Hyphomicrobiales bacterium]
MSNNPVVIAVKPQDADQTADDDPGPSPYILIEYEKWAALDGVEALVARACEAAIGQEIVLASREVTVLLSSDEAVTELNASFRGKPRPTNVLSFPFSGHHYSDDPEPLGDIIIAYETVMREANDENKQPLDHLAHLTVHGLLHLAGYGHDTEEEAECMEALERIILADLDISDPYHIVEDDAPLPAQ